ncbi:MAG TPA: DUF4962 domain-containing protein [archaeon]|nr:DUF4962 domain-containing protein [archaeon]
MNLSLNYLKKAAFYLPGPFLVLALALTACGKPGPKAAPLRFTAENTAVPLNESMLYNRCLVWRPADSLTVRLNPPRLSWPYEPTIMREKGDNREFLPLRRYRLQLALDREFNNLLLDVKETEFNFYNTIGPLPTGKPVFWRVGYYDPEDRSGEKLDWQRTRHFAVDPEAVAWDRSNLKTPRFFSSGHPRIIFSSGRLEALRRLHETDPHSKAIYDKTLAQAEEDLNSTWFRNFPETDTLPDQALQELYPDIPGRLDPDGGELPYLKLADRLIEMAFAYMLTGDRKFRAVTGPFLTLASYPPGGRSSPEGLGGNEDYVALNEYLSLFYDWFYNEMTPAQREKILACLRWRVDHIVNSFSWRSRGGSRVYPHSIAVAGSSHPYENINYTFPSGLAAYEEGGLFKTTYELAVNFLTGVSNCFGPEDAWNEGPGYGLSKFKWMIYAACYYEMTLEDARLGLNPFLSEIGEFFNRVAVLGLPNLSFGNIGIMEPYYLNNRLSSFRKLAYLTSNERFLKAWEDAARRSEQIGYTLHRQYSRPWIEYALPLYCPEPAAKPGEPLSKLFPDGGWVSASTLYPGELDNFDKSVGITFHARPRGAFNHSFFGDNSFQIYAFGQNITHAGGSTQNGDRHAHHSMSQNLVLVDGLGQAQPSHTRWENFRKELFRPYFARVSRYREEGGTVYFKGEAAGSYIRYPYHYFEFWGFLGDGKTNPYDERDLSYLTLADRHVLFVDGRYFVMLDDLAVSPEGRPQGSSFSWLYHVLQDVPLAWDEGSGSFSYATGGVTTVVKVISSAAVTFEDRKKEEGLVNPVTGEDYRPWVRKIQRYDKNYAGPYPELVTHNIWITNREPVPGMRFLAVIYPYREGTPAPRIEKLDHLTVRVSCGTKSEIVTFAPEAHPEADLQVEL